MKNINHLLEMIKTYKETEKAGSFEESNKKLINDILRLKISYNNLTENSLSNVENVSNLVEFLKYNINLCKKLIKYLEKNEKTNRIDEIIYDLQEKNMEDLYDVGKTAPIRRRLIIENFLKTINNKTGKYILPIIFKFFTQCEKLKWKK